MAATEWRFAIDVGGTFTDVIARAPDGRILLHKLLSSGRCVGTVEKGSTCDTIVDPRRHGDPDGFWTGWRIELRSPDAATAHHAVVRTFESSTGRLCIDPPFPAEPVPGMRYELNSNAPAPVTAMRYLMHRETAHGGDIDLRLGTTRATNALLERKGARTIFVTTRGFGDILQIANQDRPRLFDLHIIKPAQLAQISIELDERLAADGSILVPLDADAVRRALSQIPNPHDCALAVCLLHAHCNPAHEEIVARVAEEVRISHVSLSSRIAPLPRIVARGDTTVVDAYLAPVVRDYVRSIAAEMPAGRFRMMTSAGGLVDAARVVAKDTLLSGPAGGVVGCAHVAKQAGLDAIIGFDMGGTSTDVSRVAGSYAYQFETTKGGVRVVAPMLAVETVAAGGGSICAFDGQKLTVGPASAGARPGPACYGGGGPLTVTDANLLLGKIVPRHFPFPLDEQVAADQFTALAADIERTVGKSMSPVDLAWGFARIANENMAAAIRRISVEKGYDPREHALVAFGGAGGQHACAVAELLGIERILLSPLAGVLSAWGIAAADVKHFAERSVGERLDAAALARLEPVIREMERNLADKIVADGVEPANVQTPVRMLDLRYAGTDFALTVSTDDGDYAGAFERLHEQLYGYRHAGRAIEIAALRIERTGSTTDLHLPEVPPADGPPTPIERSRIYLGKWVDADVFDHRRLGAGHRLAGPAVVIEETSTSVVHPNWSGEILPTGDILLTCESPGPAAAKASTASDPVRLELFNNRFAAIAERMGATLRRTALSTNVKERLDYSCALFDAETELVANAQHMPVHLGSMGACVQAVRAAVPNLAPGDVVLNNDPYSGGTHIPDVTCVTPLFASDGRILFYVASRAHHAEIGGTQPGSLAADAISLAEEGVLIRHFKVVERGRMRTDELRNLFTDAPHPSRAPDENIADICAQIAANQAGINALGELLAQYGENVVLAYTRHVRDAAEAKMRTALGKLGDGTYTFTDALDDGSPIRCRIDVHGGGARIDFTGSAGVHPGNFNANIAIATSAVLYCFRCLIAEDIPLNAGVLAPLDIVVPEGMLAPPAHADPAKCPAVGAGNVETSQRIVDVIFGALAAVAASQGTMNNVIFGSADWGYYETIAGGSGAGPGFEGTDAVHTHMTNTRQTDPEILEARYPVRLRRLAIRRGSGGLGRHRGGDGLIREIEFLKPVKLAIISQRRTCQPFGLRGGEPGAAGVNTLVHAGTDQRETLPGVVTRAVEAGDVLTIETPGGGGYGEPK